MQIVGARANWGSSGVRAEFGVVLAAVTAPGPPASGLKNHEATEAHCNKHKWVRPQANTIYHTNLWMIVRAIERVK